MRDTSVTLCDTSLYCTQEFLGLCRPQCARANRSRCWPSELMCSAFLVGLPVLGVLLCIIYILILFPLLGKLCIGHLVGFSKCVQLCSTGGVAPCLLILFFCLAVLRVYHQVIFIYHQVKGSSLFALQSFYGASFNIAIVYYLSTSVHS